MVGDENLIFPIQEKKADEKSFVGEDRKRSPEEEKLLKKQSEFEYREVEELPEEKKMQERKSLKEKITKWILTILSLALIVGLYFYLL